MKNNKGQCCPCFPCIIIPKHSKGFVFKGKPGELFVHDHEDKVFEVEEDIYCCGEYRLKMISKGKKDGENIITASKGKDCCSKNIYTIFLNAEHIGKFERNFNCFSVPGAKVLLIKI